MRFIAGQKRLRWKAGTSFHQKITRFLATPVPNFRKNCSPFRVEEELEEVGRASVVFHDRHPDITNIVVSVLEPQCRRSLDHVPWTPLVPHQLFRSR